MITIKKDAIKYKSSDGTIQNAGVLCQVGTFGTNLVKMMTQWNGIFYKAPFTEETHLVLEYGDDFDGQMVNMIAYTQKSNLKSVKIIGSKTVTTARMNSAFLNCSAELIDFSECSLILNENSAMQSSFSNCAKLKEIKGVLDVSLVASFVNTFAACNVLEEVRFLEENIFKSISLAQSPLLSAESIQSIIDGLATVEEAQTLTFHADVKAKLTESQIATITSKNWTLA